MSVDHAVLLWLPEFSLTSIALMQTLWSVQPAANDSRALMLTAFAASGDENGVRRVIEADPGSVNELGLDGTSPLCAAAMWGHVTLTRREWEGFVTLSRSVRHAVCLHRIITLPLVIYRS